MKKISQIVAYYNEEKYILESIDSLLNQTYKNVEVIAISDGSTDKGPSILSNIDDDRLILINNSENHGQGYCRNQGMDIASGEYIGFFDGDDISDLRRLELLSNYLDEHEDVFCVSCDYEYIDEYGNIMDKAHPSPIIDDNMIKAMFLFGCPVGCSCALFRRELVDKYNLRELVGCKTAEDYHFWLQCLQFGKFANVIDKLFYYRQHSSHSKIAEKSNLKQHEKWMTEVFQFAWTTRGFDFKEAEMRFLYRYLYKCSLLWWPHNIIKIMMFKNKVARQLRSLAIEEKKEIMDIIDNRIYILIPYLYPIRAFRRHKDMKS